MYSTRGNTSVKGGAPFLPAVSVGCHSGIVQGRTTSMSSAQTVSKRIRPISGCSIRAARTIRSQRLFSGFLLLAVLVLESLEGAWLSLDLWYPRRSKFLGEGLPSSSACKAPKSNTCIFVPGVHLNAGTPAVARRPAICDPEVWAMVTSVFQS